MTYVQKLAEALELESRVAASLMGARQSTVEFVLPCPPSVNAYWRAPNRGPLAGRFLLSREGRGYRGLVASALLTQGIRLNSIARPVRLGIELRHRRRVDLDNYLKPLLDALKARPKEGLSGVIADDRFVDEIRIWRGACSKGAPEEVRVRVELIGPEESAT